MSDMTQSFIEMVEAYKAKPELESQIATLEADNGICYQTIELKRTQLEQAEAQIAELTSKLAEVTRERDDAMFRSLELDEKLSGIEKLLGVAERLESARQAEHQATVDAMTPTPLVEGQSESLPTTQTPSDNGSPSEIGSSSPAPTEPKINPYSGFPIHYPDGEYKGQPYYDKPSWVSWAAWCDAGGEAEPYMQQVTR